jgi:Mrp family chromosome partitioning ATPase
LDRIRKALDLARQERERTFAQDAPRPHEAPLRANAVLPANEVKMGKRPPGVIQYATTKTFPPSASLFESNRIIDISNAGPAESAFRMLRTQVLQRLNENNWRSLAVFSPSSDDGKTTTAINLAISLANDHMHTVLLVDLDLKRPTIASKLGISPHKGIDDLLRGDTGLEECLYHPEGIERLVLLPARGAMAHSSEALAGPRARELVSELHGRYADRILVFDLPPILEADDALAFAPLVECGLVVVAEGATRREDLLQCMELLRKTPVIGTVLNRATDAMQTYG